MLTTGVGIFTATRFARIATLPGNVIIPLVLAICFIGAYSISGEIENIFVAAFFGVVGYMLDKYQYSRADMAIGMVLGLMIGVELVRDRKTKEPAATETARVMELCKDDGVLIGRGGFYNNVLRLTPPLVIDADDVQRALRALDRACTAIEKPMAVT